jgi:mutator protein MutT
VIETTTPNPVQLSTIVFLKRRREVLLARKKRGFGEGKWNGCGGKLEAGETAESNAVRETLEEVLVRPRDLLLCAHLDFEYVEGERKSWKSFVFVTSSWEGEPAESEEMIPRWFDVDGLPFGEMWADDEYWLPRVLRGEHLKGSFRFNADGAVVWHELVSLHARARKAATP